MVDFCLGHIRDLAKARQIPKEVKKGEWVLSQPVLTDKLLNEFLSEPFNPPPHRSLPTHTTFENTTKTTAGRARSVWKHGHRCGQRIRADVR